MAQPEVPFSRLTGCFPKQKVVDIGAYQIAGEPVYAPLLVGHDSELVGFEPNPQALAELQKASGPRRKFLPYAIGDGRPGKLHICAARDMSSLLRPNPEVLRLFHGFPIWGQVIAIEPIDTVRLDDIAETEGLTFLQMDIQGAELLALQNAQNRLRDALVLHIEVEFLQLYADQPLFSDVELFLRQRGFVFHRFSTPVSRVIQPLMVDGNIMAGLSQLVWSDAVFVRDFSRLEDLENNRLLAMAAIVHDCYNSWDLALHLLNEIDRRTQQTLGQNYLSRLTGTTKTEPAAATPQQSKQSRKSPSRRRS
jgi:FkbM family methyltransferase